MLFSKKIVKSSLDAIKINVSVGENQLLKKVLDNINSNDEIKTLWKIMNVMAIDRLGMSDHGPTHFNIVANNGQRLIKILEKNNISMSIVTDFGLTNDHAEAVVFLACIMHDLGISIHRDGHEGYSLFIARDILKEILSFLPIEERMVVTSEILHAIISHRANGKPKTVEAGIMRIADAIDMGKGRSRITYKRGEVNIYSESDLAINNVEILEGNKKPIEIRIHMTNPAGVFQVDEIMTEKLVGSNLEKFVTITAYMMIGSSEQLYKEYSV
ncbi:MAG: Metal dependent phosphohydrolase [Candidatus Woesebacteria bacterium GW2011_GWA1_33_30]|uniref:Metal dependent phosphohydrolase n=1 Tax=Candidatus Woesebacteria bacterium GW2011_GWA2_33_28 TaxID=1618561 RepID=A0A0F9ZT75_9BACT|nr:MAG: Metal dependent phosphohydrolase [Candidatus Woesebacteria bacterium GW2011_GWA2_33_28]KKP48435.1 MAG: Metal dependent phosphohydrolase [Candidatus Woesebacteria bacterium GW2011_GWA1_33_30]KKP49542.1 MAG: Metal dependent phosphohydrolase [Microgenomates group bacterium GW2011_GWC1_33_32]KKP52507.1 MAG: Metal dependent phosphohydrolase [Candidatus Woesebacteria bacterium GW2011_GWB1_33_38]KKP56373.1 MAG: Metal dependent phosphohydrolase [Microgenomates group bacterium GW2011_GWD1_33_9]